MLIRPVRRVTARANESKEQVTMLDIGLMAIGVGFFVASIIYVFDCEMM